MLKTNLLFGRFVFYLYLCIRKINIKPIKKWKKKNTFLNRPFLIHLKMNQKQLVQVVLKNITINFMDKFKLVFIGVIALLTLASCTSDYFYDDYYLDVYYHDDYYHDNPTPQIMIGRWVNEDYTSPYKVIKLYRNGTYNIIYKSNVFTSTLTGRWYFIDRYLYFYGDMNNKLYVYSLEYPQISFSNGSIWRKNRLDGC